MSNWRDLMQAKRFEEAEQEMLAETEGEAGLGPDAESRGWYYEAWGDMLSPDSRALEKYREAHYYWAIFASWSTSGGEGTARMMEVNRVLEKIDRLNRENAI